MAARRRALPKLGFSLMELVIVVLVLAIFAAMGAWRYAESVQRIRVENAARTIAADLQFARTEAQRTSSPRQVQFSTVDDSYTLLGVDDLDDDSQTYTVDLDDSEFAVEITLANFGGSSVASFDMYGRPVNAGSVSVQSGSETRTVTLNADGATSLP